jgi:hypothetical protein
VFFDFDFFQIPKTYNYLKNQIHAQHWSYNNIFIKKWDKLFLYQMVVIHLNVAKLILLHVWKFIGKDNFSMERQNHGLGLIWIVHLGLKFGRFGRSR